MKSEEERQPEPAAKVEEEKKSDPAADVEIKSDGAGEEPVIKSGNGVDAEE